MIQITDITFVSKDKVKYTKGYITDCDKESSYMFCWRMLDVALYLLLYEPWHVISNNAAFW